MTSQWDAESSVFSAFDGKSQSNLVESMLSNNDGFAETTPSFAQSEKTLDDIGVKNPGGKTQLDLDWEKQLAEANRIKNRRLQGAKEEDINDPFVPEPLKQKPRTAKEEK